MHGSSKTLSLDGEWLLAMDPENVGLEQEWYHGPVDDAVAAQVPGNPETTFTGYWDLTWYWLDFEAPENPHGRGRYLLRFWMVSYKSDVWVNGAHVGDHEGGEDPFVLDVTREIRPNASNRIAVRAVIPGNTDKNVDGLIRGQMPLMFWEGGILDSVELLLVPPVRIDDLWVRPDPTTGNMAIQATVRNVTEEPITGQVVFTTAPAASGETVVVTRVDRPLGPGDTTVEAVLTVSDPRIWELNDPFLYRVTARVTEDGSSSFDEQSTRCGFRDFRFEDGYFRFNGRRILLQGSLAMPTTPVSGRFPYDPGLLRRDLLHLKVMGFNMIRFIAGMPRRFQLEMADEIGLLVYEESHAAWLWDDSPQMPERFDHSVVGMLKRDRNHPSIVIWGLQNENFGGELIRHAARSLPLIHSLDDTRVVLLNSGRHDHIESYGSISNPGSPVWEDVLDEGHPYQWVPHSAESIERLRNIGDRAYFMSEFGNGRAQNLSRESRLPQQVGVPAANRSYIHQYHAFMADWTRWRVDEAFGSPEDFFRQCVAALAPQRRMGFNAIRANPNIVGYLLTGTTDFTRGGGLHTDWRELKPGTVDAMFDVNASLRWCLFSEPWNLYAGTSVRLEAVLANHDALLPGEYPARLQLVGPESTRVLDRRITITIPAPDAAPEPPFAVPVFSEDVVVDGPSGEYRFLAAFERGAAASGGETLFYVDSADNMPPVETEVVLWGEDAEMASWLTDHGVRTRSFDPDADPGQEVILASSTAPEPGGRTVFRELIRRIGRGSAVVFLSPKVFNKTADWYRAPDNPVGWLPLVEKGSIERISDDPAVYAKDEWAKRHPIFNGLPVGLMDHTFYRTIIPHDVWRGQETPTEAVAGAHNTGQARYTSGLMVAVYQIGSGSFILNALRIRENLGQDPVAERLLRNMLRYAADDLAKPPTELPADFDAQLNAMGL